MDSSERENKKLKYMISDTRLNAPDGFTEKVMTRVTLERVTRATHYESQFKLRPVLSVLAVAVLLISVSQLPANFDSDFLPNLSFTFSGELKSLLPDLRLFDTNGLNIPVMFVYLSVSVFILIIFDRFLSSIFRRSNEK